LNFEIKLIVRIAAWIEAGSTKRTPRLTLEILADGQFSMAGATQNCPFIELGPIPYSRRVAGLGPVAKKTRIITSATGKLDRYYVQRAAVMGAAGTWINLKTTYRDS
jgi:hypothetical protein